jgi:hypothetical protein
MTRSTPRLSRRELLKLTTAGVLGYSMSGWLESLAAEAANHPQRRRSCILLWMNGGPSQMDTFDLKPGHVNGGPFREIATATPGLRISEHLPRLARHSDRLAIIRAMSSGEGDHGRATYFLRTGYRPTGSVQYPTFGSLVSKELGSEEAPLPNFVSIAPYRLFNQAAYSSGFLGPQYAPLLVGDNSFTPFGQPGQNVDQVLRVQDMERPRDVTGAQADARFELLQGLQQDFVSRHPGVSPQSHLTAYQRALRLMRTEAARAFNLEEEPSRLRDAYGRSLFGQGCLLARRLVERGVPFVEVALTGVNNNMNFGWDTHIQNFNAVRQLSEVLDPAWATLMEDLKSRGLLDTTLIAWMGEFGRTPRINPQQGRDHWPNSWTTVLAGGGIKGGQVFGRTSADGTTVEDPRPVTVPDFLATVCQALGIDHTKQNRSNVGRPFRIVDNDADPIEEIVA